MASAMGADVIACRECDWLHGRIERFEAGSGRHAQVEATWTARRLPQGAAAVCRAAFTNELPGRETNAAAAALSAVTIRLADAVAFSLARLHQGDGNRCP